MRAAAPEQPSPAPPLARRGSTRRAPRWPRWPIGALSPAGSRGRLSILIFHRVHDEPDAIFPREMTAAAFRERMTWMHEWFTVLPLADAIAALSRGTMPRRAMAITFDDGYADNATVALPVLRELGLHATFFIATGFLDGGRMWNDTVVESVRRSSRPALDLDDIGLGSHALGSIESRRLAIGTLLPALKHLVPSERLEKVQAIAERAQASLPTDLMMSSSQVRSLAAAGMGIGAHTVSHPILATLDTSTAQREIVEGRETLAGLLSQRIALFAYPNGKPDADYRGAHVKMAREAGFDAAVSTAWGAASIGDSLHELPRFTPWGGSPTGWAWRLARNYRAPVKRASS